MSQSAAAAVLHGMGNEALRLRDSRHLLFKICAAILSIVPQDCSSVVKQNICLISSEHSLRQPADDCTGKQHGGLSLLDSHVRIVTTAVAVVLPFP